MEPTLSTPSQDAGRKPLILSRSEHPISRSNLGDSALRVLYRLSAEGHRGYLVGGGVRDLFLGKTPKDFDVATDARPARIKKVFRNSRIIGRRFRIAHVYFPDGAIIEVSTFRRGSQQTIQTGKGTILRDNEYGTPEEDALRRDLTINGLFYDIDTFSVIDFVGGVEDLKNRIVRTINDPDTSFAEDPVRMIRAQRHAARTGFEIEPETWNAIVRNRDRTTEANPSRLLEEILKDLRSGMAAPYFEQILESRLFDCLLPPLAIQLRDHGEDHPLWRRLRTLDQRVTDGASLTTPVLLSVLLHTVLLPHAKGWSGGENNPPDAESMMLANIKGILSVVRISRRDTERIMKILITHRKLVQSIEKGKLQRRLEDKEYLAEALDFAKIDLASRESPTDRVLEWRAAAPPPRQPSSNFLRRPRPGGPKQSDATNPAGENGETDENADREGQRRRGRGRRRRPRRKKSKT